MHYSTDFVGIIRWAKLCCFFRSENSFERIFYIHVQNACGYVDEGGRPDLERKFNARTSVAVLE